MDIDLNLLYEPDFNPRKHPEWQIKNLARSLETFGQRRTISVWPDGKGKFRVLAGNGITFAARSINWKTLDCTPAPAEWDEVMQKGYTAADNQGGAEDDQLMLANLLEEVNNDGRIQLEALGSSKEQLESLLESLGSGMLQTGEGQEEEAPTQEAARQTLAERFIVPPFSVLDARQGYWQTRKRAWIALGIQSELGRGVNALDMSATMAGITDQEERAAWNEARRVSPRHDNGKGLARKFGQDLMRGEYEVGSAVKYQVASSNAHLDEKTRKALGVYATFGAGTLERNTGGQTGTSIFDPVLCELVYRWFSPEGASILDPFAGGSVRGIVAAKLGRRYTGIDLRPEQIEANRVQARAMGLNISWHVGDSRNVKTLALGEYDLVFSCPPYADLEVYSDNPQDLSTLDYPEFLASYRHIIAESVSMLKQDRFACFVVGDVRDKKGFYRNFVSDTIAAFQDAGATLYNEAILVTVVGSLPIRVGKQFQGYRKLGKTHQNVLVFYKGNPGKIKTSFGEVEAGEVFSDEELPE